MTLDPSQHYCNHYCDPFPELWSALGNLYRFVICEHLREVKPWNTCCSISGLFHGLHVFNVHPCFSASCLRDSNELCDHSPRTEHISAAFTLETNSIFLNLCNTVIIVTLLTLYLLLVFLFIPDQLQTELTLSFSPRLWHAEFLPRTLFQVMSLLYRATLGGGRKSHTALSPPDLSFKYCLCVLLAK